MSIPSTLPGAKLTGPATVRVPGELPGRRAPATTIGAATVPVPRRVPAAATVIGEVQNPLSDSVPACTVVGPEKRPVPVRLSVPVPTLVRLVGLVPSRMVPAYVDEAGLPTVSRPLPRTAVADPDRAATV